MYQNQLALELCEGGGGEEFFPTPIDLIDKLLNGLFFTMGGGVKTILEPSAGKGNIIDRLLERSKTMYGIYTAENIDAIEIDSNLRHILSGKGYRVVHDDFLTYETYKVYDLIVMNPPFSDGDKHLLKALEMQRGGGKIRCILNAETIRNPYTNSRKALCQKLSEYNASIEYVQNAFLKAERSSGVEVALISVDIPDQSPESDILENLKKEAPDYEVYAEKEELVEADFLTALISRYRFEIKAGIKLINEAAAMSKLILYQIDKTEYNKPILTLKVGEHDGTRTENINSYVQKVRKKYWQFLFNSKEFGKIMTSDLYKVYMNKLDELADYEFSLCNIYQVRLDLNKSWGKSIEETIVELFDTLSYQHSYSNEYSKNIHYYNGWKTNKSWKINTKVILPLSGYGWYSSDSFSPHYRTIEKLQDIEKSFNYLAGKFGEDIRLPEILKGAESKGIGKNIECKWFKLTFFKKGTCHITFTDEKLLQKLNLYGCQRKGWLPPSYGKIRYKDLDSSAKAVIDEYEGEAEYEKVIDEREYFLSDPASVPMLAAGNTEL